MSVEEHGPVVCPNCAKELPEPRKLCPFCRYPLLLDQTQSPMEDPDVASHKPTEHVAETQASTATGPIVQEEPVDSEAPAPQPKPAGARCLVCGRSNDPARRRCAWCAADLDIAYMEQEQGRGRAPTGDLSRVEGRLQPGRPQKQERKLKDRSVSPSSTRLLVFSALLGVLAVAVAGLGLPLRATPGPRAPQPDRLQPD